MIHEEALYHVYVPLPLLLPSVNRYEPATSGGARAWTLPWSRTFERSGRHHGALLRRIQAADASTSKRYRAHSKTLRSVTTDQLLIACGVGPTPVAYLGFHKGGGAIPPFLPFPPFPPLPSLPSPSPSPPLPSPALRSRPPYCG